MPKSSSGLMEVALLGCLESEGGDCESYVFCRWSFNFSEILVIVLVLDRMPFLLKSPNFLTLLESPKSELSYFDG